MVIGFNLFCSEYSDLSMFLDFRVDQPGSGLQNLALRIRSEHAKTQVQRSFRMICETTQKRPHKYANPDRSFPHFLGEGCKF